MGSRPERVIGHKGTETRPLLLREAAVGNIGQWTESLIQQFCVHDEVFRNVKCFQLGRKKMTVPTEEVTAKYVPAAAVIRMSQALSGFIGRKARLGGYVSLM